MFLSVCYVFPVTTVSSLHCWFSSQYRAYCSAGQAIQLVRICIQCFV